MKTKAHAVVMAAVVPMVLIGLAMIFIRPEATNHNSLIVVAAFVPLAVITYYVSHHSIQKSELRRQNLEAKENSDVVGI